MFKLMINILLILDNVRTVRLLAESPATRDYSRVFWCWRLVKPLTCQSDDRILQQKFSERPRAHDNVGFGCGEDRLRAHQAGDR